MKFIFNTRIPSLETTVILGLIILSLSSCVLVPPMDNSGVCIYFRNNAWFEVGIMSEYISEDSNGHADEKTENEILKIGEDVIFQLYRHANIYDKYDVMAKIWIVDPDTLEEYGWEKTIYEKKYLQEYIVHKYDIKDKFRDIYFPPIRQMEDIEMNPPLGTYPLPPYDM